MLRSLKQLTVSLVGKKHSRTNTAFFRRTLTIASFALFFSLTLSLHLFAAPPGSEYTAGETLDPTCAPGDTNCSVESFSLETGVTIENATAGSILFAGAGGVLAQDNTNLFWDDTNDRLGVGTATPLDTLHINGFLRTEAVGWTLIHDGATQRFYSFASFNGYLYAGRGQGAGLGDVLVYDGETWSTSFDGSQEEALSLAVYDGKLYMGQGQSTGDADVYVCDPKLTGDTAICEQADWSLSYDGSGAVMLDLVVYDDKLYAGMGNPFVNGAAEVLVFDGSTWSTSYDEFPGDIINSLAVHNGKLYAGQGDDAGEGDIYVFDGSTWSVSYNGAQTRIFALATHDGKLYAGQGQGGSSGDVLVYDGETWSTSFDGSQEEIRSLVSYNGKLYAGQAQSTGDGDIYVYDGSSWEISYDSDTASEVRALAVHEGKLYAGFGDGSGKGDIYVYSERLESQLATTIHSTISFNEQYQHFTKDISLGGNFVLSTTTATDGIIKQGSSNLLHTYGTNNLFLGVGAGNLTMTGTGKNVAIGTASLDANTSGVNNVAIGFESLSANTSGESNTAIGTSALTANTTGEWNIAIGIQALFANTTGTNNTAIGGWALHSNTTGSENIGIGTEALSANTIGQDNIAIGDYAGYGNETGSFNTFLGYSADTAGTAPSYSMALGAFASATGVNAVAIGSRALASQDNTVILGSINGVNSATATAKVGIGTTAPSTALEIGSADLGDGVAGPILTLGRNTNATNTGAGSINFQSKAGTAGYVWQDAAGNMRINTNAPTNANDTAGTVIGAQTSTRDTKQNITPYTDYSGALGIVLDAPLSTFRYIKEVEGYGSDSPLAKVRIGYIADEVDPVFMVGNVIDQVSVNGLLLASIKELNLKIEGIKIFSDDTFLTTIREWLASATNGILKLFVKEVETDRLRVGEICIDEDTCLSNQELRTLFQEYKTSTPNQSHEESTATEQVTENSEENSEETLDDEENQDLEATEEEVEETENTEVPTDSVTPEEGLTENELQTEGESDSSADESEVPAEEENIPEESDSVEESSDASDPAPVL